MNKKVKNKLESLILRAMLLRWLLKKENSIKEVFIIDCLPILREENGCSLLLCLPLLLLEQFTQGPHSYCQIF